MPILDLQRSLRRLGRIRMGNQVPTANGKMRPNKLERWRLTSPSEDLLQAAAVLYGGEVKPWEGAPGTQRQWELYTEADGLDIVIPPAEMAHTLWYELWSGGGCQRRCDGRAEQMSGEACLCPADTDQRRELAGKGEACKPTTRLFVILPRVPDVGMWMLEAHGYYAAVELAGSIEVIQLAASVGNLIPARLRIDQRSVKRDGKTINFAVPVIELPSLSAGALMTGEAPAGQLAAAPVELGAPLRAIEVGGGDPTTEGQEAASKGEVTKPSPPPTPPAAKATPAKKAASKAESSKPSPFPRAIRNAWRKNGTGDEGELCALVQTVIGRDSVDLLDGPGEANALMDAIAAVQRGDLVLEYPEGRPVWAQKAKAS